MNIFRWVTVFINLSLAVSANSGAANTALRLGVNLLPTAALNIFSRSTNQTQVLRQVYEPLFLITENAMLSSPFFTNWKTSAERRIYEFTFRENLHFSDGTPIEIEDIKKAFERSTPDGTQLLPNISKITIKNQVLSVELKRPSAIFIERLSDLSFAVTSKKLDGAGFPLGSGAFYITSANANEMTLQRNPNNVDFTAGDISKIVAVRLDKLVYSIDELLSKQIQFFPLLQVNTGSNKPLGFNRVIYPSHRVNIMVLNMVDQTIRTLVAACMDPSELKSIPYFESNSVPYSSVVPSGIENYLPSKSISSLFDLAKCEKLAKQGKRGTRLRFLNIYRDERDIKAIEGIVAKLNSRLGKVQIDIVSRTLTEAQEDITGGTYELFMCGVGSPFPLAEGILADFVYSQRDKNKLIKFVDKDLANLLDHYRDSEPLLRTKWIAKFVNHLISKAWVVPFARRIDTFLIPEQWSGLTMINGMNGNFYLGKVKLEKDH